MIAGQHILLRQRKNAPGQRFNTLPGLIHHQRIKSKVVNFRRMNVAITRAQEQLFVIGDSATIGADNFYNSFLTYIEKYGTYRTVWEFEI